MNQDKNIFQEDSKFKHPFSTPTGYFDHLEEEILQKLEKQKVKRILFPTILKVGIAASFLILIGIYFLMDIDKTNKVPFHTLTYEEINVYMDQIEFEPEDIISVASLDDLNKFDKQLEEEFTNTDTELLDDSDLFEEI